MNGLVKICGVKSREAVKAAEAAGATHIGFMFVRQSPRLVAIEDAADLARQTNLTAVAVLADPTDDELTGLLQTFRPAFLQLHGREEPQRVAHINARFGVPVIKALGVSSAQDIREARAFLFCADMLLFDAKPAVSDEATGGHGKTFDWSILTSQSFSKPWMLSGGLSPGNVAGAIQKLRPNGVDVSSGVESARGVKDVQLISQFCAAAIRAFATETVA